MQHTKTCLHCGETIIKPQTESLKNWKTRHKYCSKGCVHASMKGKGIPNAVKFKKGQVSINKTHGLTKTRFWNIWHGMKRRCYQPTRYAYPWYGGKGIKVAERWHEFLNFRDDMYEGYLKHVESHGEKQTSLDRIDSSKDYSKENCRWATLKEQGESRRRKNNN